MSINKGDLIKFAKHKRAARVQAANDRYAVCTWPFFNTVLYTVIDFKNNIRGTEGVVFSIGAESPEQCVSMIDRLQRGLTEISYRNRISLDIEKINGKPYERTGSTQNNC